MGGSFRGPNLLALERGKRGGGARSKSVSSPKRGIKIDTLFLMDAELWPDDKGGQLVAKNVFKASVASTKQIESWAALAKEVGKYSSIRELVLYFHGANGQLTVGGEASEIDGARVRDLFVNQAGASPQVENITLLGCNVGRNPAAMVEFGSLFKAKAVIAYTWFLVINTAEFEIDKGTTEKDLKASFKELEHWIMPPTTYKQIAQGANNKAYSPRLLLMYGSLVSKKLTMQEHLQQKSLRHTKPIREAKDTRIPKSKIGTLDSKALSLSFERVTVTF